MIHTIKNKLFAVLASMVLVAASISQTACPQETAVNKAAKASYQFSGLTKDVVNAVSRAYDSNIISKSQKDKIADKLIIIARSGGQLNQILAGINKTTGPTESQLSTINRVLSQEIAGPFLEIIETLGAVGSSQAAYLRTALSALRTAILVVSAVVSQDTHDLVMTRTEAYG